LENLQFHRTFPGAVTREHLGDTVHIFNTRGACIAGDDHRPGVFPAWRTVVLARHDLEAGLADICVLKRGHGDHVDMRRLADQLHQRNGQPDQRVHVPKAGGLGDEQPAGRQADSRIAASVPGRSSTR
jgi:hypothetical protein